MWNVKAKVIPVLIGASGTISKSLTQYLSNIPGKHEIKELAKKKTHTHTHSRIGHCTNAAKSVTIKVPNIFHGRSDITFSTNCKYRTAETLYTLKTWLVSGIQL